MSGKVGLPSFRKIRAERHDAWILARGDQKPLMCRTLWFQLETRCGILVSIDSSLAIRLERHAASLHALSALQDPSSAQRKS